MTLEERELFEKNELPKTERELALIDFANNETNKLLSEVDRKPYSVPPENYHLVSPELFRKIVDIRGSTAATFFSRQGILFNAEYSRANPLNFGTSAFHETLHLKGRTSFELEEENGLLRKTPYRTGVSVIASQKIGFHGTPHEHFEGLHEAIVSAQEKKSFPNLLNLPELAEEKKWLLSEEAKEIKSRIAEQKGLSKDEITWVGKEGEDWETFPFFAQRQTLNYVCSEIQKQFPENHQDTEEVFKEFLKAHFTGRLLPIGRLVEKTFGKGSFRLLGNMTPEKESAVLHLESLRKARARVSRETK